MPSLIIAILAFFTASAGAVAIGLKETKSLSKNAGKDLQEKVKQKPHQYA